MRRRKDWTTLALTALGWALLRMAGWSEIAGNLARLHGESPEEQSHHLQGLALGALALACFAYALYRFIRGPRRTPGDSPYSAVAQSAASDGFDPDEVMARYLAQRAAALPPTPSPPARASPPRGFGRKGA